jgi:hypothetical protein
MKRDGPGHDSVSPWRVREDGLGWVGTEPRTVGRSRALLPGESLRWNADMLRLSPLCGRWFPKGVYRFRTWEEEHAWTRTQTRQTLDRRR